MCSTWTCSTWARRGLTQRGAHVLCSGTAMKAIIYLIFTLLQTGVVFAQSSAPSSEQRLEDEIREIRERRQRLEDELARLRSGSQSPTPTNEGFEALSPGSAVRDPSSGPEAPRVGAIPSDTASRPPPPPPATSAPVASAPVSVGLPTAAVDGLLKRGKELFASGDIAGARALFLRAAAGNDPSALTALAQTYDPQVLGTMRVRGIKPDPVKAKTLYDQAEAARKRR